MSDCIFCQIVAGKAGSSKVYETESAYAFLDINPVNEYHTLVIPKKHYTDMFDLPEAELLGLMSVLKYVVDLYGEKLGIDNLQIINCSGEEAQQDVFHIHYHIVPRSKGDGQNIKWTTHPEMRNKFDEMLKRLE
ncbi:MAG: HIT domain-containing protein [Spirochaetales bacterium]|nr:HIT domain-containing protein [Spirochaetales bacterium]